MSAMNGNLTPETMKELLAPLLEKGFVFSYFHEKGGDSSCVYISRFQKGRDFFDWREVSGSDEVNLVVFVGGEYKFPSLKLRYKKAFRKFAWKHFFRRATMQEKRKFYAELLLSERNNPDFFGIKW